MGAAVISPSGKVNFHNVNCVLSENKKIVGLNIYVSVLICRGIRFTFIQAPSRALAPPFSPGKASHQLKHCCCYFCRFTLIHFRQTYFTARRIHERQRRSLLTAPGSCQSLTRTHPQGPTFTHTHTHTHSSRPVVSADSRDALLEAWSKAVPGRSEKRLSCPE